MRGDTSDRVAGAELTAPATHALVTRAKQATSLVEVQRLVSELRELPGIRDAALEASPGSAGTAQPGTTAEAIVGPPAWALRLRVRASDDAACRAAWPAVEAVAAAAESCLTGRCRALPADRVLPTHALSRALLGGDRAVLIVIDPAVGWAALSEAFDLVLGYDRQAPPAVSVLDLVHPDDQAVAVGSFVDACTGHGAAGPFDLRVRTLTGGWRTLEVAVRGLLDDPRLGAVAYLGIDVTAQRAAERSLREDLERLRAATASSASDRGDGSDRSDGGDGSDGAVSGNEAVSANEAAPAAAFMPSVAHELRGPLSSVVAFAHLLADPSSGSLNDDQRGYLEVIDRNANRLLRLIEELLLLSRLQAGALPLKLAAVRVPALLEGLAAERSPLAEAAGVALAWDVIDGPELICDEARVQQVVGSLVANALGFTPAGGRVTVVARPTETGWQFVVSDTGIGIPAADQPKLFNPFFRASNVGAANPGAANPGAANPGAANPGAARYGTGSSGVSSSGAGRPGGTPGGGLGLVISRAIVELHGGVIDVASTEGVGTTVTVSIPMHPRKKDGGPG